MADWSQCPITILLSSATLIQVSVRDRVLQGHSAAVRSAAFSPDGRRIVTASDDRTARVWDVQTGEEIAALREHTAPVRSAVFSPDGLRVVSTQMAQRSGDVTSDNNTVTSNDSIALLWDALSGRVIRRFEGHGAQVYDATFSPDGKRIVTASADNTARIWDAATGATIAVLNGHSGSVLSAAFSRQGDKDRDGVRRRNRARLGCRSAHDNSGSEGSFRAGVERCVQSRRRADTHGIG